MAKSASPMQLAIDCHLLLSRTSNNRYDISRQLSQREGRMKIKIILATLGLMGFSTAGFPQDAEKGATVFKKCMVCHTIEGTAKKLGPSLQGIVGRKAASVEGYKYSDAMLAKAAEGVIWDEATLAVYLPDPKKI